MADFVLNKQQWLEELWRGMNICFIIQRQIIPSAEVCRVKLARGVVWSTWLSVKPASIAESERAFAAKSIGDFQGCESVLLVNQLKIYSTLFHLFFSSLPHCKHTKEQPNHVYVAASSFQPLPNFYNHFSCGIKCIPVHCQFTHCDSTWTNTSINTFTHLPAPQHYSPPACPAVTTADWRQQTHTELIINIFFLLSSVSDSVWN